MKQVARAGERYVAKGLDRSRLGATVRTAYTSPAIGAIYGVELDAIGGAIEKWAAMIVPDDRDIALQHIERARLGEAVASGRCESLHGVASRPRPYARKRTFRI